MKTTLVSPYPLPMGGISIHIQGLEVLLKQNNCGVRVYGTIGLNEGRIE